MLNKRLGRILISLVLTIVCLVAYYFLVYDIGETTQSHTGIPATFTGLMAYAILDFLLVIIMDQGQRTSRGTAKFKNGLYRFIAVLHFIVGAMVVLSGALDYTDITHSGMQLSTLMFVAGFVGTAVVHSTAKIAVYKHIYHGDLPKALLPFVHIVATLVGYVVGVIVSCLGMLAPFLYGIANLVAFVVALMVFCKRGYMYAEITEGYNTSYSDDVPFNPTPARKKQQPKNNQKPGKLKRHTIIGFEKTLPQATKARNSLAYNEIERKLRSYLPTLNKKLSASFPLKNATINVTHVWDDVGYNIMLRFHFSFNTTKSSMDGYEMEEWGSLVSQSILAVRDAYEPTMQRAVDSVYDMVYAVITRDDPYYNANWMIDSDTAEDLVIE